MIIGVIPARLESTRFPRKILFPINNRPMIVHVYERAMQTHKLDKVLVAVDSTVTKEVLNEYGIESIMTSKKHKSGTDRIAEAISSIEADIIINLQADEPMIEPKMINELVVSFDDEQVKMATLASSIITDSDLSDKNVVKVAVDENQNAIGFYRSIVETNLEYLRHIGIYGYRKETLETFTTLPQSINEKALNLEQLRALDNGFPIKVIECDYSFRGIDTPGDLKQFN